MNDITQERCQNHKSREAVAKCPACGRYFCRECITEHEDRVLCASCLRKTHRAKTLQRIRFSGFVKVFQFLIGGMIIWLFFFYLGQWLISFPDSFHDGTLWQTKWWDEP